MRIGHGYDVHRLVPGRKLILGGVEIPFERGLDGHSDADVRALLGTEAVNVKATTEEGLGFTGSGEGIACHAVCLLEERA